MDRSTFIATCNSLAEQSVPFLFVVDFELQRFHVYELNKVDPAKIYYVTPKHTNVGHSLIGPMDKAVRFEKSPMDYNIYLRAFNYVMEHIMHGNSFLLNLTFPTSVTTNLTLEDIFMRSRAKYKLLFNNRFTVFSPETFIKIEEGKIWSYPMKGTIDAGIEGAAEKILADTKEQWEHNTIVDLIRNDLSMVAKGVEVSRFRYIDRLRTFDKELLQVSSEVCGALPGDWKSVLGEILVRQLPAGSVSGAPKKKTLELIAAAEQERRGYFTGIFGIFDGEEVDSAVMIRYIEKTAAGLQYRSGGGITGRSNPVEEYNEMLNKVYVPIF